MKKLHFDCTGGARKDQLLSYMYGLLTDDERALALRVFEDADFEAAGAGSVSVLIAPEVFAPEPFDIRILINGETEAEYLSRTRPHHFHRSYKDALAIIDELDILAQAKTDAKGIYEILATAEARAHSTTKTDVHFHEVGNDFAIASIVLFCVMVNTYAPSEITSTPITTGFGMIDCAHGRLAIPAPATANILEGLPTCKGSVEGELTTPTGAAMVRYYAWENK